MSLNKPAISFESHSQEFINNIESEIHKANEKGKKASKESIVTQLFIDTNKNKSNGNEIKESEKPNIARNITQDYYSDLKMAANTFGKGSIDYLRAMVSGSKNNTQNRGYLDKDVTYSYSVESIANRHKDAISNIINDLMGGNLLDVGLESLRLHNNGTKYKFARALDVNKDVYPFKYWYYNIGSDIDRKANEPNGINIVTLLDSIEDPTKLGYTFKIDEDTPLFSNNGELKKFIGAYSVLYRELEYANSYLQEFKRDIVKIFNAPSTMSGNEYSKRGLKPHYIASVNGLNELDKPFVKHTADSHDALTITLNEDVRMFTNRLAFLYRNLTYSYNMGKRLIPENLLRFNLFIKIADYRSFTGNTMTGKAFENDYSRVIYELKDCEFIFDKTITPEKIDMGGYNGLDTSPSQLVIKIKYRKVNRIFYSSLFSSELEPFLIGDIHFNPNITKTKEFLDKTKMLTQKRASTTNNISVEPSVKERYDNLKNNGLMREDDNDSAVGRFLKTATNNATKAMTQPIDEGLKKVSNILNNINVIGQKSFVRKALTLAIDGKIALKTGKRAGEGSTNDKVGGLGRVASYKESDMKPLNKIRVNPDTYTEINISESNLHGKPTNKVNKPNEDLHEDINNTIPSPNADLHPDSNYATKSPNDDLHEDVAARENTYLGDLHEDVATRENTYLGDLHENVATRENTYLGDLHDTADAIDDTYLGDLHGIVNHEIELDNANLSGSVDSVDMTPNQPIQDNIDSVIEQPSTLDKNAADATITAPDGIVNNGVKADIESPDGDVIKSKFIVETPEGNINNAVKVDVIAPKDNKHDEVNYKVPQSDKYTNLKEYLKKRPKNK
jgi:hypothetical protein